MKELPTRAKAGNTRYKYKSFKRSTHSPLLHYTTHYLLLHSSLFTPYNSTPHSSHPLFIAYCLLLLPTDYLQCGELGQQLPPVTRDCMLREVFPREGGTRCTDGGNLHRREGSKW